MKANIKKTTTYNLELTEAEAAWLRGVMQNPLYDVDTEEEHPHDAEFRESFYNALSAPAVKG